LTRTVVWTPRSQVEVTRHLNWAASGAAFSASRASSSALTLTPLSTVVVMSVKAPFRQRSWEIPYLRD